jgi:hypothetical protein
VDLGLQMGDLKLGIEEFDGSEGGEKIDAPCANDVN